MIQKRNFPEEKTIRTDQIFRLLCLSSDKSDTMPENIL